MKIKLFNLLFLLCFLIINVISPCIQAQEKPLFNVLSNETIFTNPAFAQCHASTLIELKKDKYMVAWFEGSYEGSKDVCIWAAIKHKGKWSNPKKIVCGDVSDTLHYACWNPVLFRSGKNEIILYYKVGPSPREWWGMQLHSFDNGETWGKAQRLNSILGPVKNKPVTSTNGCWLNPTSIETMDRWQVFIERSIDKGKTWQNIAVDTANPAKVIQPCLLLYPNGKIQALCRSNQNYIMESWSTDDGKSWSPLQKTDILNPNSGIDAITLTSGLHLLVYNPMISGKDWVNGRNKLYLAYSIDGKTWIEFYKLEDQPEGEYSYPAIIQSSDEIVHIIYTYNRKTIKYVSIKLIH
ncbi:MAG: exo-alpha-sialidase [Bacteroidetes bacterium]|nr:exo-alpha-sialidase [Bacteroidota bacterium]